MADSRILRKWQKGDTLTAAGVNEIQDLLQSVTHAPTQTPGGNVLVRWVRLIEHIGPAADFQDREAVVQYWDEATDKWKDTNPEQEVKVSDLSEQFYFPEDSIIPVFSHRSGKLVPLSGHATSLLCKATADLSKGPVSSGFQIWSGTIADGEDSGITELPEIEIEQDIAEEAFFLSQWTGSGWVSIANPISLTQITFLTAFGVDEATNKFQYKTRTARVVDPEDESAWTVAHIGEVCGDV